jgi:hypothetical protein
MRKRKDNAKGSWLASTMPEIPQDSQESVLAVPERTTTGRKRCGWVTAFDPAGKKSYPGWQRLERKARQRCGSGRVVLFHVGVARDRQAEVAELQS